MDGPILKADLIKSVSKGSKTKMRNQKYFDPIEFY